MTATDTPPTTERQWQPGYRPGAPGAFLGAAFVIVWTLWLIHGILLQWQHPLTLTLAFLVLPLVGFVALNLVNLLFAGLADVLKKSLPPLRRYQRQTLVSCMFLSGTTAFAAWWLVCSQQLLPITAAVLWLAALVCHQIWRQLLRRHQQANT